MRTQSGQPCRSNKSPAPPKGPDQSPSVSLPAPARPAAAPPPLKPTGARSRRGAAIPTNDCRGGAPSPLSAMLTDFLLVCSTVLKQAAAEPASRHLTAGQIESCPSNTNLYKCAEWAIRRRVETPPTRDCPSILVPRYHNMFLGAAIARETQKLLKLWSRQMPSPCHPTSIGAGSNHRAPAWRPDCAQCTSSGSLASCSSAPAGHQ